MSPMPQLRAAPVLSVLAPLSLVLEVLPLLTPLPAPLPVLRAFWTIDPFTTVTLTSPRIQVNGNTSVMSPVSNRRRAVIGV